MKISQGDTVAIMAGKDKGKKGTVLRVLKATNRVVVGGINMVTKHVKKTAQSEGKKLKLEHSIHASNVMVIDPKSGKPTRIGYKVDAKTGFKLRISKKSGAPIERVRIDSKELDKAKAATKEAKPEAKKSASPFWKKGAVQVAEDGSTGKAESGPAKSSVSPTRSGGRGS